MDHTLAIPNPRPVQGYFHLLVAGVEVAALKPALLRPGAPRLLVSKQQAAGACSWFQGPVRRLQRSFSMPPNNTKIPPNQPAPQLDCRGRACNTKAHAVPGAPSRCCQSEPVPSRNRSRQPNLNMSPKLPHGLMVHAEQSPHHLVVTTQVPQPRPSEIDQRSTNLIAPDCGALALPSETRARR